MAAKRKHKFHVARKPAEVAKYKQRFVEQLAKGCTPGVAAEKVNIARATAYGWKIDDKEFDAAWQDAIEVGIDKVEHALVKRAITTVTPQPSRTCEPTGQSAGHAKLMPMPTPA